MSSIIQRQIHQQAVVILVLSLNSSQIVGLDKLFEILAEFALGFLLLSFGRLSNGLASSVNQVYMVIHDSHR